jgi:transposase
MNHESSPSSRSPLQGLYVGIDVAKDKVDLALGEDDQAIATFANDAAGINRIVQLMIAARPAMIVIESTGGLERPLLEALLEADLPVALVHPGRVRHFAKAMGLLAKNDRLDARLLARFGRQAAPRLLEKRSKNQTELNDLLLCRRQLTVTRTQQVNRRGATVSKAALKSIDAVLATLDKQIHRLDQRIAELIDADDDFKHLNGLLKQVPGVGPMLSATLTADLRELGEGDRQRVCALVGVAPFDDDSGKVRGKRCIRGGRMDVRNVLYMATLAAMRCNPVIRAFAQRLRSTGKVSKVVIVACMRKLLSLLNAMVRENLPWHELNVVKKLATNH